MTLITLASGGATGALLPYIERAYHFGYAQVSVLFVCTFLGYVVSAATAGTLTRRIGYGHTMLMSAMVELAGVRIVLFFSPGAFTHASSPRRT